MENYLYHYKAELIRCVDGDSAWMMLDLGFFHFSKKNIRLARINTPEIRGSEKEKGKISFDAAENYYNLASEIIISSNKFDSFGRVIAEVYLKINEDWINLNDRLVEENYAIYKKY